MMRDDAQAGRAFAEAIMTTDTKPKQAYREFSLAGRTIRIAGAAKGSGMMAPNMATMLAFITTDARIAGRDLQTQLSRAVGATFNRITIDGQMSTNDMVAGFASGMAGDGELSSVQCETFGEHLHQLCNELALAMVADGEGATRVFHVTVAGGRNAEQVHKIARAVADSLLVKTAVHGADPNWGRIVSAAGAARAGFDPQKAVCSINGVVVFKNGEGVDHDRAGLAETMTRNEVEISLELGAGDAREVMHSCDLSKKYVDINALYHT